MLDFDRATDRGGGAIENGGTDCGRIRQACTGLQTLEAGRDFGAGPARLVVY